MIHTRSLINNIVVVINNHRKMGNQIYTFDDIKIDNILCQIIIYFQLNIFVIKTKNIFVTYDGTHNYSSKYIPYHFNYKTINDAILQIYNIHNNYKFFDGVLMNKHDISKRIYENKLFNILFDKCCICYNNTNENTLCNHTICIHCREKMISTNKLECPICRKSNIIKFFNHKYQSIYNLNFDDLLKINNHDIFQNHNEIDYHNENFNNLPNSPLFELFLVRELIHFNLIYPFFFAVVITNKIYINRTPILFTVLSTICLYYFINHSLTISSDNF